MDELPPPLPPQWPPAPRLPPPLPPLPPLPPRLPVPVIPITPAAWYARPAGIIGIVLVGLVVFGGLAAAMYSIRARHKLAPVVETTESRNKAIRQAFTEGATGATPAEVQALHNALALLLKTAAAGDRVGLRQQVDGDRLADELIASLPAGQQPSSADERSLRRGAQQALASAFVEMARVISPADPKEFNVLTQADKYETVRKVIFSPDRSEALVYDVLKLGSGASSKSRWWLRRSSSTWNVYDKEDLDGGVGLSTMMGEIYAAGPTGSNNILAALKNTNACLEFMRKQQWAAAESSLAAAESMTAVTAGHPKIAGMVKIYRAILNLRTGKFAKCLDVCDEIESQRLDVPLIYSLRTEASADLQDYDGVISNAHKWINVLGDDEQANRYLGYALEKQSRPAEAAEAYRKSLEADPDLAASWEGLARVAPSDSATLAKLFAKCHDRHATFNEVAGVLQKERAMKGERAMIAAYRANGGDSDPWLAYREAEVLLVYRRFADSMEKFEPILPLAPRPGNSIFLDEYLFCAAHAGPDKIAHAYELSKDQSKAFLAIAAQCLHPSLPLPATRPAASTPAPTADAASLRRIVEVYRPDHENDPWLYYYDGKACELEHQYPAADTAYAKGFPLAANAADRTTLMRARASARFAAGNAMTLYHDVDAGAKESAFDETALGFVNTRNWKALNDLVTQRRADAADSSVAAMWAAYVQFTQEKYTDAVAAFAADKTLLRAKGPAADRWRSAYIRGLARLHRGAEASHEIDVASSSYEPLVRAIARASAADERSLDEDLKALLKNGYKPADFYADFDLKAGIMSPSLSRIRAEYPAPATQP